MTNEFDGFHATTAMAGTVQPAFHQPDPADVGGMGTDVRHFRARRPQVRQAVPDAVDGFSTDDGVAILLTYGPNREAAPAVKGLWRPIFARLPFEQAVLLTRI
jgi:hypothetical protein